MHGDTAPTARNIGSWILVDFGGGDIKVVGGCCGYSEDCGGGWSGKYSFSGYILRRGNYSSYGLGCVR